MDIAKIDKNFALETNITREGLAFCNIRQAPFSVHGVYWEDGKFRRLPESVAKAVSPGVHYLSTNTAGGRVRFVTDSPYVVLKAKGNIIRMSHFAPTGSAGYDMFEERDHGDSRYLGTFRPPMTAADGFDGVIDLPEKKERVICINFPLYSEVEELYLGLQEGCSLRAAPAYRIEKPVVFYGSSITQGGCASKPGSSYQSILSREFDFDYINLGFSGNAKGEDEIVDYIKGLEMSLFVLDYDNNAPTAEHLENTHEKMFLKIREAHPQLPIVMMPRPKYYLNEDEKRRRAIVERTYWNARQRGDENAYYISNVQLMKLVKDNGTVDNAHPTDSGFLSMAAAISEVFQQIL